MIEISPRLWPSRQAFALKNLESWNVHLLILPQKSLEEHNKRLSICSVYHQHHIQWFVAYNNKRPQSFCGALSLIFRRNVHCLIKTKEIIGTRNQVITIYVVKLSWFYLLLIFSFITTGMLMDWSQNQVFFSIRTFQVNIKCFITNCIYLLIHVLSI